MKFHGGGRDQIFDFFHGQGFWKSAGQLEFSGGEGEKGFIEVQSIFDILAILLNGDVFSADGSGGQFNFVLEIEEVVLDAFCVELTVFAHAEPVGHAKQVIFVCVQSVGG